MEKQHTGRIVRSISGFYDVQTGGAVITCRARGILRRENCTPLTGDMVSITVERGKGMVEKVLPRRNCFVRPAVANIDALVVFAANVNPVTEPFLIDRVAAIAGDQEVPVYLCVNKCDLDPAADLVRVYRNAGFPVICTSAETGGGVEALRTLIKGKLVAFTGNSGVGKSSILNRLAPELKLSTGEVSEKLGRGRHTTRHVELYSLGDDTFVMDTPGFSSFDTDEMDVILKENLQYAFARMKFPGRDVLFYLYLFSMMVPTVTNLIPQFLLMKDMKLVDSYLGLLLIYIGIGVPQNTFFLRNFFLGLPKELEEAVTIDGGNRWQIYWKMVLPLSKPALGTFAILAYSNVWDEFLIALTMIKTPEKRTLPIALRLFQGQNLNNWGLIFAASLIAVVPILLIYIVMQKKLIHGGAMDGMLKG